jgi:hypothetical protein
MATAEWLSQTAGRIAGLALSPVTGALSALRRSRMFHPRGLTCRAEVEALPPPLPTPVAALVGPALVRWSSAWWKRGEGRDVLGCAIRFSTEPLGVEPRQGDQDLLLATIQRPWSLPASPWTTQQHDFLANHYYGVSPFLVHGRRVEWRLVPELPSPPGDSRRERLERAMRDGSARLRLEMAPYGGALRRPRGESFESVARITLRHFIDLDQEALRFDPFRSGRGLEPVGFVHAIRRATYLASQNHRPKSATGGRARS